MAFGKHWEWRGFGSILPELRGRIESSPRVFPAAQKLTDIYLWSPRPDLNVKLRFDDLKLKRLLETNGAVECWLEDPAENYEFPLSREVLERLERELDVRLPPRPASPVSRTDLLELLKDAVPPVPLVAVEKERWQHEWRPEGNAEAVTLELAEIWRPERVTSIGVEHPARELVEQAVAHFQLNAALARRSYVGALSCWVHHGSAAD